MLSQIINFIFENWLEWLFMAFMCFTGWGYRKILKSIKNSHTQEEASREGVQALLRDRIIHSYNKYTELGYCPIYAKENVKRMYKPYHALGGNDVATEMVETLIKLPASLHNEEQ